MTLERLTHIFPHDIGLKNDLGVAHLLLGDNKGAKKVYEEVCVSVCVLIIELGTQLPLMFSDPCDSSTGPGDCPW